MQKPGSTPKFEARIYQMIKTPGMNSTAEGQDSHSRGWQSLVYVSQEGSGGDGDRLQVRKEEQQTQPWDLRDLP